MTQEELIAHFDGVVEEEPLVRHERPQEEILPQNIGFIFADIPAPRVEVVNFTCQRFTFSQQLNTHHVRKHKSTKE